MRIYRSESRQDFRPANGEWPKVLATFATAGKHSLAACNKDRSISTVIYHSEYAPLSGCPTPEAFQILARSKLSLDCATPGSGLPEYSEPPVAPKVYSNLPITIKCPDWCEGSCSYELFRPGRSFAYTIKAGEKQRLKDDASWKIRYDQGNGLGRKTYSLRDGKDYELRKEDDGKWAFYAAS